MVGADATKDAEHALDKKRRLHESLVYEVRERVQVADVVALELEAGAFSLPEIAERALDHAERVVERMHVRVADVLFLPVEPPLGDPICDRG